MKSSFAIERLAEDWSSAGVQPGDFLMLHSSLRRTFERMAVAGFIVTADDILDSFLLALGNDGTLVVPLFNMEFCSGTPFDIRKTPSRMGLLTETVRLRPEAVRTGHPMFSYGVLGAEAEAFVDRTNIGAYDEESLTAEVFRRDGKIGLLDVTDKRVTFYHYVEERLNVPFRFHKTFEGDYIDATGNKTHRKFTFFARDIDRWVVSDIARMEEVMNEAGAYQGCPPGEGHGLRIASAREMYRLTKDVIEQGRAIDFLYRVGDSSSG